VPSTHSYAQIAKAYEKYNNNNSTFNNKSLSDNRPITNFYAAKAHGVDSVLKKTAYINDLETQVRQNLVVPQSLDHVVPNKENSAMYSLNMLNQLCDDNQGIKVSVMPSSLTEVPRVSEKYELKAFSFNINEPTNLQCRSNLKTMELLRNNQSGQACLNLNPAFFGETSARAQEPIQLKDSFADILEKQTMWQNRNKFGATAGGVDLVNYSELHHPMSHHNVSIGNDRLTTFPTDLVGARTDAKLVKNGYYAKEALQVTNSLGKNADDYEAA
jgi:hypothetical protein